MDDRGEGGDRDEGSRGGQRRRAEPPTKITAFYRALTNRRTRPTCMIAGLAILLMSLIYCGGLAVVLFVERDPGTGQLVPRLPSLAAPPTISTPTPQPTPMMDFEIEDCDDLRAYLTGSRRGAVCP